MHKFYLSLYIFLSTHTAYSATQPMRFDVGDIPPRGKIKINMNQHQWPGYHDIKCDIVDPSYSSIIKISTDDNSFACDFIEANNVRYPLPFQISMSKEKNSLFVSNYYNREDEKNNYFIFENLDDDVTVSVKNCEVSPHATLNENYMYLPSEILCIGGDCKLPGQLGDYWGVTINVPGASGKYKFNSVYNNGFSALASYYPAYSTGTYVNLNNLKDIKYYQPVIDANTKWYASGSNSYQCSIYTSSADCPFYKPS